MQERQRLKRPDPVRTGPHRNFAMMYRHPDPRADTAGERLRADEPAPSGGCADTVADGVRLAYGVIDDYMVRLGQQTARQSNDRPYGWAAPANDLRDLGDRILQVSTQLGTLWLELASSLVGTAGAARAQGRDAAATAAAGCVAVEVIADQPTRVTLELRPGADAAALAVYPLRAPDPACPPLADVALERAPEGQGSRLRVRVPAGQPAGVYSGVVVDARGEARGTLSVAVGAAGPAPATSA